MEAQRTQVYLLSHIHILPNGDEDAKLIGVYSSMEGARSAQARASALPGFKDIDGTFDVACYPLDKDEWTEGFVSVQ